MTTGGYSERFSPEERNARPFINLWPKRIAPQLPVAADMAPEVVVPVDTPAPAMVAPPVEALTPPTEQL